MADNDKKYAGLAALQTFLDNLKNLFATKKSVDELSANIDGKADASHSHVISDVTDLQSNLDVINDTLEEKSQVQVVSEGSSEVLPTLKIHKLTQEEYDQAIIDGTLDANAIYLTPEEEIDLSNYATIEQLAGKADLEHSHDDLYYTESEVDTLLSSKADSTHNHDSAYDAFGSAEDAANTALDTAKSYAKEYTDTAVSGLASASSVSTSISTHNTSTDAHNDIRELIADLSTAVNKFLDVDDITTDQLSEVLTLIENNKGTLESLTTSKINVSDIIDNLTTASTDKVLSANQGVVIQGLIDALQEELNNHTHEIAANASDDEVVVLTGTNGTNGVTYSASHADSGVAAGTYNSITVDAKGHVTGGSNPTTISGYGITDAYTKDEVDTELAKKSNTGHIHAISDVTNLQSSLNAKVPATRTINGKALSSNITLSASDVNADASGSASSALSSANTYTDGAVAQKTQVQIITWEDDD